MMTLRARPILLLLAILLALTLLTGVAYAIGRLTGFIPGIGFVETSALRVLAEPVSVTRDGITLTVEQVMLSTDKTVLVYTVEGIPADAYEGGEGVQGSSNVSSSVGITLEGTPEVFVSSVESAGGCVADTRVLLPNGSMLGVRSGEASGWISGFESRIVYDPIPTEVDEATFLLSCVEGTIQGRLPENWKVPLRFIPAPPDLTVLPVVDVIPSESVLDGTESAMTLEKVIETDSGYILIGKFRSIGLPANAKAQGISDWIKVVDANGQAVDVAPANNMEPSTVFGELIWGYEIEGKQHAWPLTLKIDSVNVLFDQQTTEIKFDTGANPQTGQVWILNQDAQIAGYTIRVISIERTVNGYSFIFKADPSVIGITVEIKDFPFASETSGSDGFGRGDLFSIIEYEGDPPAGKLTIQLGWLIADIQGPWQVQWSP